MRSMHHDEGREILRQDTFIDIIPKPGCVGGRNDVLVCYELSDGRVVVLRRTAKVPYYAVKYFYEVYMPMEVRV